MPKRKEDNVPVDDSERLEVLNAINSTDSRIACTFSPELAGVLSNSIAIVAGCGGYVCCWFDNSIGIYSGSVRLGTSTARIRATESAEFVLRLWKLAEKFRPMHDKLFGADSWPGPTAKWMEGLDNPLDAP